MADFDTELNCRGLVEVVTDYLEGELTPAESLVIDRHLDTCEGCRRYLRQMRITIATVGRFREDDVPAEMRQRLMVAFREMKKT